MRLALLAGLLGLAVPATALAAPPRPVVWKNTVLPPKSPTDGAVQLANVARTVYLNDCRPSGCQVFPGIDENGVFPNKSSIPQSNVVLNAYPHGQAHWDSLVQCVKDTFAPFDITVVTTNPGSAPHYEVMVGGNSRQLHPELEAGGVAPFIGCGTSYNNVISFVFPESTNDLEFLCGAVVQEAAHVWGLDHELDAKDPLTYLELGSLKRFQNNDAPCGEDLGAARRCFCGGNTQNTFRFMTNAFGLAPGLAAPTVEILTPRDGAWVKSGFPITANVVSPLEALSATVKIDNATTATLTTLPFAANAPATLTGGDHAISVTAQDFGDRSATAAVNVHVMTSCAGGEKCASGFHCLGGVCYPGAGVDGGLGAGCEANEDCATGTCGSDGSDSKCTAACDAGNACPSGYECLAAGASGVCWPSESGGCSTNGNSPVFLLAGLGALVLGLRKRRR